VLLLPGSGDELQGMKKGVLELAQVIVIHKADGPQEPLARLLAQQTSSALRLFSASEDSPRAPVLLCSSTEGRGLAEVWDAIAAEHARLDAKGMLEQKRRGQRKRWLRSHVEEGLIERLRQRRGIDALFAAVEKDVEEGRLPASAGARQILDALEPGG
jgi:LAO/AO transport system kinase